ncbi:hypothetical protein [Cupriavidus sp. AU9028]|uniref:hypothetical protein n=1 Tax=Cupriavidus sp. AU9028 TaxID=2871157 RepID=UPI001C97E943|nr:hypothetical protein [Cupriavidus sp. AU9028]MBY4898719.1 hypothetical protein [Cupriavidus sp. AU9028]
MVDLYHRWSTFFAGQDRLSPRLVARLYAWLVEAEGKNHPKTSGFQAWKVAQQAQGLTMTTAQENELRNAFLLWCRLCPSLTEAYLRGLFEHPYRHVIFRQLLSFVGTAAYAAPKALADLFLSALTGEEDERDGRRSNRGEEFPRWDHEFFPPSPARPPFLTLLEANKNEGLRLVRGVVAHAVRWRYGDGDPGENRIEVPFPSGPRSFPWRATYMWSRSTAGDSNIIASALMALEGWAHLRLERGESVQSVIDDVLGSEGSPAAYLLVAVDVLLSHWPTSREVLWPLAASAQLLAIDKDRFARDTVNLGDGLTNWVRQEPAGTVQLDSLRRRQSRRHALDDVLVEYGWHGPETVRVAMQQALRAESEKLGEPDGESRGLADPRFAAMSALNRLDRSNYKFGGIGENGGQFVEYVPPAQEAALSAAYQQRSELELEDTLIRTRLMRALTEPPCPALLLDQGVRWASDNPVTSNDEPDKDEQDWTDRTKLIVAALILRDGTDERKAQSGQWAHELLLESADRKPDDRAHVQQLPYNAAAIAAVGLLAAYGNNGDPADLKTLLQLAARRDTGMAAVLRLEKSRGFSLPPMLQRSLIRLGFVSAIYAVRQHDEGSYISRADFAARQEALEMQRKQADHARLQKAVTAEFEWLTVGGGPEPDWPALPDPIPAKKIEYIRLKEAGHERDRAIPPPREFALDANTGAEWLKLAADYWHADDPDALRDLVRHCWPWTAGANGVGCGSEEEPGELAFEWNDAYFAVAVLAGVPTGMAGVHEYVLHPLGQLPDERFLDATAIVLHAMDKLWCDGGSVSDTVAISIRESLAQQMATTRQWRRLTAQPSEGMELHLGPAVAAMFMGYRDLLIGPSCYVSPPEAARASLVLPLLIRLVEEAATSSFVAVAMLELVSVRPHADQLSVVDRAVAAWWRAWDANARFWIDSGVARRACEWMDKAVFGGDVPLPVIESAEVTRIVDVLVQCAGPLGRALEEKLANSRSKPDSAG